MRGGLTDAGRFSVVAAVSLFIVEGAGGCTLAAGTCTCGSTACAGGATFRPRKGDSSLWCNDAMRYFCDCRPSCGAQCGACRRCDALPCEAGYHRVNCGWGSPGLCVKCRVCPSGTLALTDSCTSWSDTICAAPPTPSPTPVLPTPAPTPVPHPLAARVALQQASAAARAAAGEASAAASALADADLRLLRAASDPATLDVLGRPASASALASGAALAAVLASADFKASFGFAMGPAAAAAYPTEPSAAASTLSVTDASAVAAVPALTSGVLDRSALAQLLAVLSNLVSDGRAAKALELEALAGANSSAPALSTSFELGVEAAARAVLANKAGVVGAALSEGGELQYLLLDDDADRANSLACCGPGTAFGQLRTEVDAMAALCASLGGGATLIALHSAQEVRQVLRPLVLGAGYVFAGEGFETDAKRAAQAGGPGAGTAYSRGVPLARDIDGTNTYFDLTSASRSVQPILDALRSDHGFSGDILTHEFVKGSVLAAGKGNQQCAGLGLHQASAAGALADWECKSGTAALVCQKVVQRGANLNSWRSNETEVRCARPRWRGDAAIAPPLSVATVFIVASLAMADTRIVAALAAL